MEEKIIIRGARENNLKNIDVEIPRDELVVITGLSGSGKSSLAFNTIYAEGQRRYMESLSAYARQFLGMMERPEVDFIDGLSPVISIEQKTVSNNPRSTVGTVTEIYDFLRLLFARAGTAYSYVSGNKMRKQSDEEIIDALAAYPTGTKLVILAPVIRARKGHYRELFQQIARQGFAKVRIDGVITDIEKDLKVDRYKIHDIEIVVDRVQIKEGVRTRISSAVEMALSLGGGSIIGVELDKKGNQNEDRVFSRNLTAPEDGLSYDDPSPNSFSFNSPYGACNECKGLGSIRALDDSLIFPDKSLSINQSGIAALGKPRDTWMFSQLRAVAKHFEFDFDTPIKDISEENLDIVMNGADPKMQFDIVYKYKNRQVKYRHRFNGVRQHVWNTYENTSSGHVRNWAESFMRQAICHECDGGRLNKIALSYKIGEKNIADIVSMDLASLANYFDGLMLQGRQQKIAEPILKEIRERLGFLLKVGLEYLALDRSARSLSGGESQRIRLATQIGTQLVGVLYILDEPSIGLHPRDNNRLIDSLRQLRDLGNSVVVVEHDKEMIESADYVIDLGPGAGEHGGEVMEAGPPSVLLNGKKSDLSLTKAYLKGIKKIEIPEKRRKGNGHQIVLNGAEGHNLKGDNLELPLGKMISVTGVSGSGKSSLINQTLFPILSSELHGARRAPLKFKSIDGLEHVDKVIDIDQSPIGRTPRSNPATYTGLFTYIRDLFHQLPESQIRGYKPGRFSFNVKGGRCETCEGAGIKKLEMNFLPDVYVQCETCKTRRYNQETLDIRFKGKNISDVLNMTVSEATLFFKDQPRIFRKLETLDSVGLGYIRLGQQATTLSGGEAQRVKLATELSRPGTGKTLYILDEPTTGLHFEDIRHLLIVLQALVDKGNTVLIIEHNMDVVKVSDHVIDLGPEGGAGGGKILFAGTPEELAKQKVGYTAKYLKAELDR